MRILSYAFLIILLNSAVTWLTNLPQDAGEDVPSGKLNSLSFAPYREGQSPLDETFPSIEEIDADLQLMAQKTWTIRTYASAEGNMPAIPALAQKHGLEMIQGAWLGAVAADTQKEVAALIKAANAHPDVIKRVIVGNEVLLRGELEVDEIIKYIREVKKAVKQPVSYADVWSMYMKNPQLIKEVDFITIHILPYWEDEPISVDDAPAHIERIYKHVRQEADSIAPGKAILIGESGWPSHGRQRGWAQPGVVNEAKFIRGLIKVANANGFDCNIVEAINQSWKSALEGVVGANWGLYSVDRQEVFPLTGKVYENPEWPKNLMTSSILLLVIIGGFWQRLRKLSPAQLAVLLGFTQVLGSLLVNQISNLWYVSFTDWQRLQTALIIAANTALAGFILQRSYHLLTKKTTDLVLGSRLNTLYFVAVAFAIYQTLALAIDGRYISFPTVETSIPVVGIIGLMLIHFFTAEKTVALNALFGSASGQHPWYRRTGLLLIFMLAYAAYKLIIMAINYKALDLLAIAPYIPAAGIIVFMLAWFFSQSTESQANPGYKQIALLLVLIAINLVIGETLGFVGSRDFIQSTPELSARLSMSLAYTFGNCQLAHWLMCLLILAIPLWFSGKTSKQ